MTQVSKQETVFTNSSNLRRYTAFVKKNKLIFWTRVVRILECRFLRESRSRHITNTQPRSRVRVCLLRRWAPCHLRSCRISARFWTSKNSRMLRLSWTAAPCTRTRWVMGLYICAENKSRRLFCLGFGFGFYWTRTVIVSLRRSAASRLVPTDESWCYSRFSCRRTTIRDE